MPRNRVQHQKGLSDDAFERLYPDEEACRRAWFAWRWVACGSAIGAGDMAFMDDTRLLGNAAKPLAAVADDSRSGHDAGA